jgi:hypothetical protein
MKLNKKNRILLAGLALGFYVAYAFAIKNTLSYREKYMEQQQLLSSNFNDPALLQKMIYKEKQLNALLTTYGHTESVSFQNRLLQELSTLCQKNNLRITDFQEPHVILNNELTVSSYVFSLEGSFNGILLLLNSMENNPALGTVKHIAFAKKKNYKTNTDYLTAEIILQKTDSKNAG